MTDHPHVTRAIDGGDTSAENGQEAAGWQAMPLPSDRHEVLITTPTGHTYVSTAPDPPQPYVPRPAEAGDVVHFCSARRTAQEELHSLLA